ncbi:MAG: hypothetical protein JST75_15190 [Bacteroidetes bacterium]|nr:hypothetical protein [Bacteroidota bacterium]
MKNKKYFLFFSIAWFVCVSCCAQESKKNNSSLWQYHSINQFGFLEGSAPSAFQVQTINGVQYKSWFGGIGIGIDYYRFRSIPLFADFRKEFSVGKNYVYVYGGVGANFTWITDKEKSDYNLNYFGNADFKNGWYYDAGIGYKVPLNNRVAIFISPGFSHKTTTVKNATSICPFVGPCYLITPETYHYAMNRLSVNLGLIF